MIQLTPAALETFALASRARAEADMKDRSLADLEDLIGSLPPVRPFAARLGRSAGPLPRVIAGMKRREPGSGLERPGYRPRQIAMGFARVGAAAVSVVTEPEAHGGELAHVHEVRPAHLPVLRSDFLVTPYQLAQSRVAGADAVSLVAGLLRGPALALMIQAARRYGLEVLVEARSSEEAARALDAGAAVLGVVHPEPDGAARCFAPGLPRSLPEGVEGVAMGAIQAPADLRGLLDEGYGAFLVDSPLMRAGDPGDALWKFLEPA